MNISSFGKFTINLITLLILGLFPLSFGTVETGLILSPFVDTFIEFKSKLIKGFLILIKDNGFKSLNPKAFISTLNGTVSDSISNFFIKSLCSLSKIKKDKSICPCALLLFFKYNCSHFGFIFFN